MREVSGGVSICGEFALERHGGAAAAERCGSEGGSSFGSCGQIAETEPATAAEPAVPRPIKGKGEDEGEGGRAKGGPASSVLEAAAGIMCLTPSHGRESEPTPPAASTDIAAVDNV